MRRTDGDHAGPAPLLLPPRAARIAHDLRQPTVAALITAEFIDELLDAGAPIELVREQTAAIRRCMRHALRLTNDLSTAGQGEAEALQLRCAPPDLGALLGASRPEAA